MLGPIIIRSHADAYALAGSMDEQLTEGQAIHLNFINIRKDDGYLYAQGQIHRHDEGEQKYTPCELADCVLFPERKRINDALRTEYAKSLFTWPNI